MNANIYRFEFRSRLKSVLIWSLSAVTLVLVFFSFFSAFASEAELMNQVLSKFPPEMRAAFGLDRMDMSTVLGFYSLIFMFVQVCLAIQASNYGFGLVSIEENELTADFLLTKPVSRAQVLTSKLLAAISSLLITDVIIIAGTLLAFTLFRGDRGYDGGTLTLLFIGLPIFQLFFLSVGLVVSLLVKRVRSVTPYGLGLGFGMYVLSAFSGMLGDVKLEWITPFKHLDSAVIVQNGTFDTPLVLLNVAITLISLAVSYWRYIRRDIHAVS